MKETVEEREDRLLKEKVQEKKRERAGFLLTIFRETTNHLREENEDILLAAIFETLDLPYLIKSVSKEVVAPKGEVFLSPEEVAEITASAEDLALD